MRSYAALLRRAADTLAQSDGSLYRVRMAEQMQTLAALLERVTPEMANDLRLDLMVFEGIDQPAIGSRQAHDVLRALAAGPQGEEGRHSTESLWGNNTTDEEADDGDNE